jgi:hypothetical protein
MEKYGYKKEEKDSKIKESSEKGKCPICGEQIKGNPPVCPNHGSEPFEERNDKGK